MGIEHDCTIVQQIFNQLFYHAKNNFSRSFIAITYRMR